jgi:hypothetical protein
LRRCGARARRCAERGQGAPAPNLGCEGSEGEALPTLVVARGSRPTSHTSRSTSTARLRTGRIRRARWRVRRAAARAFFPGARRMCS